MKDPWIPSVDQVRLRSPILIAAFRGWNDAGESATYAAEHLCRIWKAQKIASMDPEDFFDFQSVRPEVSFDGDLGRKITWPENDLYAARLDGHERDVLILIGTEPSLRWRTFTSSIIEFAREYDVSMLVSMGALLADVPHSRPVPITATAVDGNLIARLNLTRSRYEGPTGVLGVLHHAFGDAGIDSASLWAAVPHYLALAPNPKAALALVEEASRLVGYQVDIGELVAATSGYEDQVNEMVDSDDDIQEYVQLLESRLDNQDEEADGIDPSQLPSGDALAAELERFLRDREPGE